MKYLIFSLLFICSSCYAIDAELQKAISFGEIKELNQYSSNVEKQLFIRLYQAPIHKENCFMETHGVCQYKYFLSVSTFDEYPETNIFELKNEGEITDIKWSTSNQVDTALISLTANKYTAEALKNNKELKNSKVTIKLVITPKELKETLTSVSN